MKILILDNYDSFTYNLAHLLEEIDIVSDIHVFRNDKISVDDVSQYDKILLSPGPGIPCDAGIMPELIKQYADKKSIIGICLGHQAIAECFGAKLINLNKVSHGISLPLKVTDPGDIIFQNLPQKFNVGRYHSWSVSDTNLPKELKITAISTSDNMIMSLKHREFNLWGLQFHPESILSEYGKEIIEAWLNHK